MIGQRQRVIEATRAWRIVLWCVVGVALLAGACRSEDNSAGGSAESDVGAVAGEEITTAARSYAGTVPAPAFPDGLTWFNVQHPLSVEDLHGKAVLLDFWTTGCINCQHIIPDLKRLEAEFGDRLAVIGVHSGKYDEEHTDATIREAILRYGLEHPVVNDEDFLVWRTYGVNAWPTVVLIDPEGKVVGGHAGEGIYPIFQPVLTQVFEEFEGKIDPTPLPLAMEGQTAAATILSFPSAVLPDPVGGRLFIADAGHNRILVSKTDGALESVIGNGEAGLTDGGYRDAQFHDPQGLALSPDGQTLYVADTRNHAVRAIDLGSEQVRTIAGTGQQMRGLPGPGAPAASTPLASPWGLLLRGDELFITMAGIHQIWVMNLAHNTIAVFAGTGAESLQQGPRREATLAQPSGITTIGNIVYWVDPEGSAVRQVNLDTDMVRNIVGTGLFDFGFRDGTGDEAQLQHPQGIVAGPDGALYVADTYNHAIRRVEPGTRKVTTLAGNGERGWADGTGSDARFEEPAGIGISGNTLYVADTGNHLIRTVDIATGETGTLTLSNLAVASAGIVPGETYEVRLDPQTVAPGAGTMTIRVSAPDGLLLNSLAPSRLDLTTSNPEVAEPGEGSLQWSSDEPSVELTIPVNLAAGTAEITARGVAYYCREGEEALCFIQNVSATLPVTVKAGSDQGVVQLDITLPERDES